MIKRLRNEDDGFTLVMSIAFLALFGVFSATLISGAGTGVRSHRVFKALSVDGYTADALVEAAIQAVRGDLFAGRDPTLGGVCPGTTPIPDVEVNGKTGSVTCEGQPNSGEGGSGTADGAPFAILALGTDPDEGIVRQGTAGVSVDGQVFSHSRISSIGGALTINGRVDAVGECTGAVVSLQPPLHCSNQVGGGATPGGGPDPLYDATLSFAPEHRAAPSCVESGSVIELEPGWYDDASALNALTDGTCPGKTLHLKPGDSGVGAYYFDFENGGTHEWLINDSTLKVIGGTPKGWIAGQPLNVPGACATDEDATPNDGVQLIFGGDSRINIQSGAVEICAQPGDPTQRIAIYGVASGTGPSFASGVATQVVSETNFVGSEKTLGPPDGSVATAAGSQTANVRLGGFGSLVPANASVDQVTVRVTHQDVQHVGAVKLTAHPGGGGPDCPEVSLSLSSGMHTDGTLGNMSGCITTPHQLNAMEITVVAEPAFPGDPLRPMIERLDAVTVEVAYGGAGLDGASGCLLQTPFPTAGCARLATGQNANITVHGTVYTPRSPIHLDFGPVAVQSLSQGIIARTVLLGGSVGVSIPGEPIGSRKVNNRTDRVVRFEASLDGVVRLRAEVLIRDGGGLTPGADVEVLSWAYSV